MLVTSMVLLMAKVIGNVPPSRTGCNKCKSIIEYYEPDDIKYIPKSIEATWRRYIECPSCDNHITVINTFDQMAFIYSLNTNLIKKDDN